MPLRKAPCSHGVLRGPCKACVKEQGKARWAANKERLSVELREFRAAHPERRKAKRQANIEEERAYGRAYRAAHPEKGRAWSVANKERLRVKQADRRRFGTWFPRMYGITYETAVAMRDAQDGQCLICCVLMTDGKLTATRWVPDHYVASDGSKVVRGIICSSCNIGIALVNDHDPAALRRAADYIEKHGRADRAVEAKAPVAFASPQLRLIP